MLEHDEIEAVHGCISLFRYIICRILYYPIMGVFLADGNPGRGVVASCSPIARWDHLAVVPVDRADG